MNDSEKLKQWLVGQGFVINKNTLNYEGNQIDWYAFRRSKLSARRCECNDEKSHMQIVVRPHWISMNSVESKSCEVELCGEFNGEWWDLKAYSCSFEDLPLKLEALECSLISAWNALDCMYLPGLIEIRGCR